MGLEVSCLKGFKVCVSGGEQELEEPPASKEEGHLQVPSIVITPPSPTGETSSNSEESGEDQPAKPC